MDRVRVGRGAGNRRVEDDDCFYFMGGNSCQGDKGFKVDVGVVVLMYGIGVRFVAPNFFL